MLLFCNKYEMRDIIIIYYLVYLLEFVETGAKNVIYYVCTAVFIFNLRKMNSFEITIYYVRIILLFDNFLSLMLLTRISVKSYT